ncbi:MBOAT family protein [Parablautia intestinalis]|uniref:MBOAT family protein n=1 Tax=Parablautia intestinalis TaxID=2320100 RepID=A0A3A9AKX9_9FIRM|nr:MBOAT family O-acyltransferase [Parablautia intestinalis]RKI92029.1 MBOAT family protein [Parablautia intestinalis]
MLFNSYIFIFIFLPLTLVGWYMLNHFKAYEAAKFFLAGMSLWFYGYFNIYYLAVIIASILGNYLISFLMKFSHSKITGYAGLLTGLLLNLGFLFYFKYYDFFFENINLVFHTNFNLKYILLPLGISFFTFQQLSFIIDRCIGKAEHYSFVNYVTFVTFFPQLIAGPIVLYKEMMPQFEDRTNRRFNGDNFAKGIVFFTIGLGKKVLLADVLAIPVNFGFEQTAFLDTPSALLVILAYTFEIYFDFSGYSDMAIGLGKMFNIELPVNFNSPYKACCVKELWQRWHMTLSRFFVQYVYIPLGGSRKGKIRTIFNTFMVFFLSGLWHGANWTYIAWGTMQGLLVIWDNLGIIGVKGSNEKAPAKIYIPGWLGWIFTFGFFNLSLFFFRSDNMADAFQMFRNVFAFKNTGYLYKVVVNLDIPEFYLLKQAVNMVRPDLLNYMYMMIFFLVLIISGFILTRKNTAQIVNDCPLNTKLCLFVTLVFVWSVISFSQVSTFIYFNF